MDTENLYASAHVFVAGVRVYEYLNRTQPSVDDVCRLLHLSSELGHLVCKKLLELGVVEGVEGAYGIRLFIKDHLKIEEIQRQQLGSSRMEEDLKKFQETKKGFAKKIESIQAAQAEKKKSLFAEMEKKLKEELEKK
jgi:hypothetical protein